MRTVSVIVAAFVSSVLFIGFAQAASIQLDDSRYEIFTIRFPGSPVDTQVEVFNEDGDCGVLLNNIQKEEKMTKQIVPDGVLRSIQRPVFYVQNGGRPLTLLAPAPFGSDEGGSEAVLFCTSGRLQPKGNLQWYEGVWIPNPPFFPN